MTILNRSESPSLVGSQSCLVRHLQPPQTSMGLGILFRVSTG